MSTTHTQNVEALAKIYGATTELGSPKVFRVEHAGRTLELRPGYYLLPGMTGAGKTTTLGALILTMLNNNIRADYYAMDEVGAKTKTPFTDYEVWPSTANSPGKKENAPLPEARIGDNLKSYRERLLYKMAPMNQSGGVLCVDSMMGMYLSCAGLFKTPFMSGGLDAVYLALGIMLSNMARDNNVALIGVLNQQVFPVPSLAGMTWGEMDLVTPGTIAVRDRGARGTKVPFTFPTEYLNAARVAISGIQPNERGEYPLSNLETKTFF